MRNQFVLIFVVLIASYLLIVSMALISIGDWWNLFIAWTYGLVIFALVLFIFLSIALGVDTYLHGIFYKSQLDDSPPKADETNRNISSREQITLKHRTE
ncbi:MAG: hypothetical protein QME52_01050 [Bacteroidota bacterium]|nr:hypothetical protein [Bacteroidota bacterium]